MSNSWFHVISRWMSLKREQEVVDLEPLLSAPPTPIEKRKRYTRRRSDNLSLADALIDHNLRC